MMRALLGRVAVAVVAGVLTLPIALSASPAHAVGEVLVSTDGATFSSAYPGALFGSIARFVPGDSEQHTFYVRNGGNEPGHLRITLRDVVAADADFADALTVSASTVDQAGPAATILSANPCWMLLQGITLAPGQTIGVTTAIALGNLHGQAGQGATAEFSIGVALHSTAVAPPPTHCGETGTVIPGTPQTPGSATGTPSGTSVVADAPITPPDAPADSARPEDLPVLNLPDLLGIDPNTWQLFEEYFVFVLIGGFIAGIVWFTIVAWRRRRHEAEPEPDEGVAA